MTLAGVNYNGGAGASRLQVVRSEDEWTKPPELDTVSGSSFGWNDRLFFGFRDGLVFDYGDWEARDIESMLSKGYKAKQIEMALSLPIMSAEWTIGNDKGDRGETEFIKEFWRADPHNGGCETLLDEIIDLNTSAFAYKRAYWELEWTAGRGDFDGKIVYNDVGWRPQTTCRLAREVKTGKMRGFEQEAFYSGPEITQGEFPIYVPTNRAYVYTHGKRRNPLHGVSDLEVPFWCYKTTQKLLFLWFQFLEGVSLPRTIVKATDQGDANKIARSIAQLRSSGVLPVSTGGGPDSVSIDALDLSGNGADQFMRAISWLDQAAVNSVLAGFLNLTNSDKAGGSFALSEDSSDFFLQTREADAREMERSIHQDLLGPMVRYNFGPNAKIPSFKFEPLSSEDKTTSVTMLQSLMNSRDPALIPDEFVGQLSEQVANYLGMDGAKVRKAFDKAGKAFAAKQAAMAGMDPNAPGVGVAPGMAPNAGNAAYVAGAVGAADSAVKGAMADDAGAELSDDQKSALAVITGG